MVCLCGNHDVGNRPNSATVKTYVDSFGDDYFGEWIRRAPAPPASPYTLAGMRSLSDSNFHRYARRLLAYALVGAGFWAGGCRFLVLNSSLYSALEPGIKYVAQITCFLCVRVE